MIGRQQGQLTFHLGHSLLPYLDFLLDGVAITGCRVGGDSAFLWIDVGIHAALGRDHDCGKQCNTSQQTAQAPTMKRNEKHDSPVWCEKKRQGIVTSHSPLANKSQLSVAAFVARDSASG